MAISDDRTSRRVSNAGPQAFELKDVVSGGTHTLVITGELDMATSPEVQAVIVACAASARRLTLDLSQLTFMDSTGLSLILEAHELCQDSGAEFVLIPGPEHVQRVFEITGLLDRLPFRSTPTQ